MSGEVRGYFLKKHISYVATFIVIWTFFLASAYYHLYMDNFRVLTSTSMGKTILDVNTTDVNKRHKAESLVD